MSALGIKREEATLSAASGITLNTGRLVKSNGLVWCWAWFKNVPSKSGQQQLATVPAGYRPANDVYFPVGYTGTNANEKYGAATSDGAIKTAGVTSQVFVCACWYAA